MFRELCWPYPTDTNYTSLQDCINSQIQGLEHKEATCRISEKVRIHSLGGNWPVALSRASKRRSVFAKYIISLCFKHFFRIYHSSSDPSLAPNFVPTYFYCRSRCMHSLPRCVVPVLSVEILSLHKNSHTTSLKAANYRTIPLWRYALFLQIPLNSQKSIHILFIKILDSSGNSVWCRISTTWSWVFIWGQEAVTAIH